MAIKMKELTSQSGESKSTILYYIKEGLLPEPSKPKPNVHLYDEACVDIIKFIKYLQSNFSYSIADIKQIFEHSDMDLDGSFEMMINSLEIATAGVDTTRYSADEFKQKAGIGDEVLEEYLQKGYIFQKDGKFSNTELEMVKILQNIAELGLDMNLIDSYVSNAKEIASIENETGARMFNQTQDEDSRHYEMLFDLILKLKPYIYNMHTVTQYYKNKRG